MRRKTVLTALCFLLSLQGCAVALLYQNDKGVGAKVKDAQTKVGKIDKGAADFSSRLQFEVYFPWKFKVRNWQKIK